MQTTQPTQPTQSTQPDLVKTQKNVATLNHLIAKYNQLYKTYLQQVAAEANKKTQRKYPYNIINPNEFKNNLTPAYPFPSNGTEDACFKSCVDNDACVYALYSKSGCGIDCNPNKCLLYGANADGVAPVKELPSALSAACPVSGDSAGTDAWCETFNHPVTNSIIPALVLRIGKTDWRSLAMQMPKATVNAADAPMTVDLSTNLQTWGPDDQFSDVNYAPDNEISLQFRFFAEYWLNTYGIPSGSAPIVTAQGIIGTFTFAKLTTNADGSTSYVGIFADKKMLWNSAEPSSGGTAAGLKTAAMLATTTSESAKFNYNYSAFEKPVWRIEQNVNAMSTQLPPQLAGISIPSWQFLGVQDSAEACQSAATDDPEHVYSVATYYNASYDNPKNGNNAFARMCYGHVAGAPSSTASSEQEDNVQTMTPPHGLTKMGGKYGIAILKKMYQLNKQIMALTDELKIAGASENTQPVKESFTQRSDSDDAKFAALSQQFKTDEAKLNAAIQSHDQLEIDEKNAKQLLLQSRIKFGVALVIGLVLAYFAFRVLTADELPSTIKTEIGMNGANSGSGSGSSSNLDMDSTY